MLFKNRKEAGELLAKALLQYKSAPHTMVLGLPRGGVVVASIVADTLKLPLDVIIPRKLGAPQNPELAIGAIAGDERVLDQTIIEHLQVSTSYIEKETQKEQWEAERRLSLYRKDKKTQNFKNQTFIIVDDGIATGSTMRVSILYLKKKGAKKLIAAVPVGPPDTIALLKGEVDEVVCLHQPVSFYAVGQFYDDFPQTEDREVIALLNK